MNDFLDRRCVDGPAFLQQTLDGPLHGRFAFPGGQMKNGQIFAARPGRKTIDQFVVGHAESHARKKIIPPAIILEGTRLANQAVDYMTIVDVMLLPSSQTRQPLDTTVGVPDFKMLGEDANRHILVDQPTRHAINVVFHVDRARTAYLRFHGIEKGKRLGRERPQCRTFLLEPLGAAGVLLLENRVEERLVFFPARKIQAVPK